MEILILFNNFLEDIFFFYNNLSLNKDSRKNVNVRSFNFFLIFRNEFIVFCF